MKLTKLEHACVVLEEGGKKLVIDPGSICQLNDVSNVEAVVVTHVHQDHLDISNLQKILSANPTAAIYCNQEVSEQLGDLTVNKTVVDDGESVRTANFELKFIGHQHAIIYESVPCGNIGVMVNDQVFYPGDAFTEPKLPVDVLLVPASAPWMKTAEAMDFIKAVKPKVAIPTHNGLLSEMGETVTYSWLQRACDEVGASFKHLKPGDSL